MTQPPIYNFASYRQTTPMPSFADTYECPPIYTSPADPNARNGHGILFHQTWTFDEILPACDAAIQAINTELRELSERIQSIRAKFGITDFTPLFLMNPRPIPMQIYTDYDAATTPLLRNRDRLQEIREHRIRVLWAEFIANASDQ